MKNSSTKKFKNHKNSPDQSCDQANNGAHFGEDKNEIQSTKSSLEIVKKIKSEDIPENSSPVCFAKSPEIRDEYKTE